MNRRDALLASFAVAVGGALPGAVLFFAHARRIAEIATGHRLRADEVIQ